MYADTVYQNIVYVPLSRGLGIALALLGLKILGVVIGWLVGGLVTLILSLYLWRNRLPHASSYPKMPLITFTLPLFTSTLIQLGQQWGDITILQARLGQLGTTGAYYLVVSSVTFLSVLWTPVAGALLPAVSASHATEGLQAVNERLSPAIRLTNLAVIPLAASLAAVAPTALTIAYGSSYASEAIPLAILSLASIFTAQASIMTATLQALGKTPQLLGITLAATVVDLVIVTVAATFLGPLAGALGRALLYITSVYLAQRALRGEISVQAHSGTRPALALALGVSLPLLATDQLLISYFGLRAIFRLPILLGVFSGSFLAVARRLAVFKPGDFAILKDALPRRFQPQLRRIERLIVG